VVSKYIEPDENLGRVFDAAEDGAAVLPFDEADTLFGKRSEVRDRRDRYATSRSATCCRTWSRSAAWPSLPLTPARRWTRAFLRRLRVVVTFPYPDRAAR
jgi:hypothetical protein